MSNIIKTFILIATVALSSLQLRAQVKLQGQVQDSLSTPLVGATVMLLHQTDETLKGFAIADGEGRFLIDAPKEDSLKLRITYIGYGTFDRNIDLSDSESLYDLSLITLRTDSQVLDGVTITEQFIPIVIKKDTVEYTADAFNTEPNANVEDLLKKLPGIEVDREGNIKAQGEEVEQLLVDGKEFFDDDPKVATRNIPADIVNKVQVYDDASEFTKFTGIEDGEDVKTINLKIKDGKNKGLFGKVDGAYGSDNHYAGAVNLNRFTKKMQLSTLSNANNINEMPFSLMDYLEFSGGLNDIMGGGMINLEGLPSNLYDNSGLTETANIGLNFNYDFTKAFTLRSNYFYDKTDNITLSNSEFRNIVNGGVFQNLSDRQQTEDINNHRLKLKLKHTFDGSQEMTFNFKLNDASALKTGLANSRSIDQMNDIVNLSDNMNDTDSQNSNWMANLAFRKRMKRKGRSWSLDFTAEETDNNYLRNINNDLQIFIPSSSRDTIDQRQMEWANAMTYKARVNYIEPLGKARYLSFKYDYQQSTNDQVKDFDDRVGLNQFVRNDFLSNAFFRDYNLHKGGVALKIVRTKINYDFGLDLQNLDLLSEDENINSTFDKRFRHLLPYSNISVDLGSNTNLRFEYRTRVNIPMVEQMQAFIDNSNPLNIYSGNPDLNAEYVHRVAANYNRFNNFYFRSFFAGVQLEITNNQIIDTEIIDDQLIRFRQPQNVGSAWNANGYFEFASPVPSSNFKLSYGGNIRFSEANILVNANQDELATTVLTQTFELQNKKKKKWDWLLGIRHTSNLNRYDINKDYNQNYFDYSFYSSVAWNIKKRVYFKADYERLNYSETLFNEAQNFDNLSAKVSYIFPGNTFTLYVRGGNLLNQQVLLQRSNNANSYYQLERNQIGRFVMFGALYKIRSFGK